MITVSKNSSNDLKDILNKYYFNDEITKVEHIGEFKFIAYSSDAKIEIQTEPIDANNILINILSMKIIIR